jgi:hypothetical protein
MAKHLERIPKTYIPNMCYRYETEWVNIRGTFGEQVKYLQFV